MVRRAAELSVIDPPSRSVVPVKGRWHRAGRRLARFLLPVEPESEVSDIWPITLTAFGTGLFGAWSSTTPINSDLLLHTLTLGAQAGSTSLGAVQARFAYAESTPTSTSEFDSLDPVFSGLSQGPGLNRGFWTGARNSHMRWPLRFRLVPAGRRIAVQFRTQGVFGIDVYAHLLVSYAAQERDD